MNTKIHQFLLASLLGVACTIGLHAQTSMFTYQGQLKENGQTANGLYDLRFALYNSGGGATVVAGPVTNSATVVSNGLFIVTLDFGAAVFDGSDRWLELAVRTNNVGAFNTLTPRQQITSTPYAIMAKNAAGAETVANGVYTTGSYANPPWVNSLAGSKVAGNISGNASGFTGALTGDVTGTQGATVVSSVGGQTAANVASGVSAANAASSANTPNTIVKRDASGDFSAETLTLGGNLNLPVTTSGSGIIYEDGNTLLHTFGTGNFFSGPYAGNLTMSGGYNTGVGNFALFHLSSGGQNTACGSQALYGNTSGFGNTAVGYRALAWSTNGISNTALGSSALQENRNGNDNTAVGSMTLYLNSSGSANTALGGSALIANVSGSWNTAVGLQSLYSNHEGHNNTAVGSRALYSNTNGYRNTAVGNYALYDDTSGFENTALGYGALDSNTSGHGNIAIGLHALTVSTEADNNIAVGNWALQWNQRGTGNTALGHSSLSWNTNGSDNVAVGGGALLWLESGTNNIGIGKSAGRNNHTGDNSIYIGNEGVNGESDTIRIGTTDIFGNNVQTNTYIAGIWASTPPGSTANVVVNSEGRLGIATSSQRFKEAIADMGDQSEVLQSLRPVSFRYKSDIDSQNTPQFGLIAEEVEQVAPELVVHDASGRPFTVRYEQVNAMLLNEFLKEHRKVKDLETRLETLEQLVREMNGGAQ